MLALETEALARTPVLPEATRVGALPARSRSPPLDVPLLPTRAAVPGSELIKDLPPLPAMVQHSRHLTMVKNEMALRHLVVI
jgi:hypothetical protein